ncbi:MAG: penicillin-binding protein 1C [Candidatus Tectomicrobia bacterium]|uniref:peptidoglycan glycosyltransferase n=1 Tax=Tectimicrobiota bacterium TaxID=2528274 RepID=A0A932CLI8_UNCTE|nr:penicillin-binding protein 1C [Candidatus Tectomicrobia bacterium]
MALSRSLIFFLSVAALLGLAFGRPLPPIPSFQEVRVAYRPSDVQLLDRYGQVLHELRTDSRRRRLPWTPLSEISPALRAAVIASEDRRFDRHGGVDGRALGAATLSALRWPVGGPRRGASTISMQVVALLRADLRPRGGLRALGRKWRQMRLAWAIERRWSKAEILEAYLNLVTFRGELQGVAAASSVLLGKAPHGITEAEAAVLAVLLRAPNAGPAAVARRAWALRAAQKGTATRGEIEAAVARALDAPPGAGPRVALAPHVAPQLLQALSASAPVRSSLDGALQRVATESLRRHLLAVRTRHVRDGAVLVADNATGEVLAYVGGSGDLASARYVDGVRAKRQAGSTLKPFLYGLALEQRLLTPASLLEDTPLELPVVGGLYRPWNYDEQFRGLVTARTALAASLNVPAVRTLVLVGEERFVQQLRRLGFAGLVESGDYYGPALALGSADVSLWELVNAYRTLAHGGVWSPLRMRPAEKGEGARRLYAPETTFLLSHILADREGRSATFGLENPLATRFWSAVKTGTSKGMRDNWCIGYSRRYTVGVWVGNFAGEPMQDVSGITGAAPVWLEVMAWLHRTVPSPPLEPPAGLRVRRVTFPREVEPARMEWFLPGTEPLEPMQRLSVGHPRILVPAPETVIALDPDIPPARQRILFEAQAAGARFRWVLDGKEIGSAADLLAWDPLPGKHTLSLRDGAQRLCDTVTFEVRGSTHASPD